MNFRDHFTYENGFLYRGDKVVGTPDKKGYLNVSIKNKLYKVHRVIMAMHGHSIDGLQVDHLNGIVNDNRIENLRLVTNSENQRNMRGRKGFGGVHFKKSHCKWEVTVRACGKNKFIGLYDSMLDAIAARMRYNRENGYTLRHGR